MQKGELVVVGKNSIHIPLDGFPRNFKVYFKNECEIVPCNPQDVDYIECDVHASNTNRGGFVLVVKWGVSGVRDVIYEVFF